MLWCFVEKSRRLQIKIYKIVPLSNCTLRSEHLEWIAENLDFEWTKKGVVVIVWNMEVNAWSGQVEQDVLGCYSYASAFDAEISVGDNI